MKLVFSYFHWTFMNLAISDWLSWCLSTLLCITSWTFFWNVRLFKKYEVVMHMMVLQVSCTCICWVMKLLKTIWIGKLWLTRTGPWLTHTLSQHGAPSLDMEATSWVKDSSLNDCSILYYNQQCTRYYFGSSPQLSFVRPGRLVLGSIPSLQDMQDVWIKSAAVIT